VIRTLIMTKTVRNISIILIIVVIAALLIIPKLLSTKGKETTPQGSGDQSIPVDVYVVKPVQLDNRVITGGTIAANEEVQIRSELTRKITGIYFKEGTYVPRGKVLFKLDDSDLLARLRKLDLQEELAIKTEQRETELLTRGLATQEQFDIVSNQLATIRADKELVEVDLDKTYIRAPFSGVTGFRNVSIGSLVTNANILTTIQDIGRIKIDFSIPEKYIVAFKEGQLIRFNVDGIDQEFTGTVVSYDPQINENTRSIILRATADNKGGRLLPGAFVKVTLELGDITNALLVPSEAIVPKLKGQSIYILRNGVPKLTDVEIGTRTEKDVQVLTELAPGDTVITTNILRLRPNSKIKVVNVANNE
jgi:membrane fusion protein (multidrug efflux system)